MASSVRRYRRGIGEVSPACRDIAAATAGVARDRFGDALRSVVLYGSGARGTARPESDVDFLVVADGLPDRAMPRWELAATLADRALRATGGAGGPRPPISIVLYAPAFLADTPPLLFDMVEDAILIDDDGLMARKLDDLAARMAELGSRRIWLPDGSWYWDLKPDLVPGEVVRL